MLNIRETISYLNVLNNNTGWKRTCASYHNHTKNHLQQARKNIYLYPIWWNLHCSLPTPCYDYLSISIQVYKREGLVVKFPGLYIELDEINIQDDPLLRDVSMTLSRIKIRTDFIYILYFNLTYKPRHFLDKVTDF